MGSSISITNNKIQLKWGMYNPAIYIPKIGKVIYGMESWWKVINNKEELKDITDVEQGILKEQKHELSFPIGQGLPTVQSFYLSTSYWRNIEN